MAFRLKVFKLSAAHVVESKSHTATSGMIDIPDVGFAQVDLLSTNALRITEDL